MTVCPNCGSQLQDGSKFCGVCGTPINQTNICPHCGAPLNADACFCPACGNSVNQNQGETAFINSGNINGGYQDYGVQNGYVRQTAPAKKPFPIKFVIIGAAALLVIAAIITGIFLLRGNKKNNIDDFLFYYKDDGMYAANVSNFEPWQVTSHFSGNYSDDDYVKAMELTYITDNGKILFFPDKFADDQTGFTLCYKYIDDKNADPEKIDSGVVNYTVNEAGNIVTYQKGSGLYQHNLEEKTKIAGDINNYGVSDDGSIIYYLDNDGDLYIVLNGREAEKEKLDSGVTRLCYFSLDMSSVYYMKDDSFYCKTRNRDKIKISSDVDYAYLCKSGEIYYSKSGSDGYSLYYYDGSESSEFAEDVKDGFSAIAVDRGVCAFVSSDDYVCVAIGNSVTKVAEVSTNAYGFKITADGNSIYYFDDELGDSNVADLYKISVSENSASNAELYDDGVSDMRVSLYDNGDIIYLKNYSDDYSVRELYMNGEFVIDGVSNCLYNNGILACYKDVTDIYDNTGTLYMYNNGELEMISEDVYGANILSNGKITYTSDHDDIRNEGNLYIYSSGQGKKLDEEVKGLYVSYPKTGRVYLIYGE